MTNLGDFDVFLSHNSQDKDTVLILGNELRTRGLTVWLDEWELIPGRVWQHELEVIIQRTKSALVIIGKDGLGRWEDPEMRACIDQFVRRKLPVIPVLLPSASQELNLPPFLAVFTAVDFRSGFSTEGVDRIVWGITGKRPITVSDVSVVVSPHPPVHVPDFEYQDVVTGDHFIDREQELEHALKLIRSGKRFMLVGEPRVGKTCFCERLIQLLFEQKEAVLATRLDLESIRELTIDNLLGHTLIYMMAESARIVFGCVYADLRSRDISHLPPHVRSDSEFLRLRNVCAQVEGQIYYGDNMRPGSMAMSVFVQHTKDLLAIVRTKGWQRFVMFYDEANKMPNELSIQLLSQNAKVLASSSLTSVFVASEEMAQAFRGHEANFAVEIPLGPFESPIHMKRLLARYYHGDILRIEDLPMTPDAMDHVWQLSRGNPFYLQHIFDYSFRVASMARSSVVTIAHVKTAIERLIVDDPRYFGSGFAQGS